MNRLDVRFGVLTPTTRGTTLSMGVQGCATWRIRLHGVDATLCHITLTIAVERGTAGSRTRETVESQVHRLNRYVNRPLRIVPEC